MQSQSRELHLFTFNFVSVFHWKGGKLARDTKPLARHRACELTAQTDQRNALLQELRKHAKGSPVQHILLVSTVKIIH